MRVSAPPSVAVSSIVPALSRTMDLHDQRCALYFPRVHRGPTGSGEFVTRRQLDFELGRLTLNYGDIGENRNPRVCFRNGDKRLHIAEETCLARRGGVHKFARGPRDT